MCAPVVSGCCSAQRMHFFNISHALECDGYGCTSWSSSESLTSVSTISGLVTLCTISSSLRIVYPGSEASIHSHSSTLASSQSVHSFKQANACNISCTGFSSSSLCSPVAFAQAKIVTLVLLTLYPGALPSLCEDSILLGRAFFFNDSGYGILERLHYSYLSLSHPVLALNSYHCLGIAS